MKKYLALKASAGSGKTFALTVRYISLLFLDVNPSSILALTFTNKSASEMNSRIFKTLNNLENEKDYLKSIALQTSIHQVDLLRKKDEILNRYLASQINIITIDKFINKILRLFSSYIGIDSDFEIEEDDKELVVENYLSKLSLSQIENLAQLTQIESKNLNSFISIFKILNSKEYEIDIKLNSNVDLKEIEKKILKSAFTIKDYILNEENLNNYTKKAVDFDDIDSLLDKGKTWLTKESIKDYKYFKKIIDYSYLDIELNNIKANLTKYFEAKSNRFLLNILSLFNEFKKIRINNRIEHNLIEFNDVTNLVFHLLHSSINRDFLYFRLDNKISHILIDEFQDTSILQYRILEPLIDEIFAQDSEFRTLFYVGDTKQSIYRFRGGKQELFDYVATKYSPRLITEELNINYRSSKEIVKFVNQTFKNIDGFEYKEQFSNTQDINNSSGFVEVINDDSLIDEENRFSKLIETLKEYQRLKIDFRTVAILVYVNKDIDLVANAIEDKMKIAITTETKSELINSYNVKAIINLIKYLYFKENIYIYNFKAMIPNYKTTHIFSIDDNLIELVYKISLQYELINDDVVKFMEIIKKFNDITDFIFNIDKLKEPITQKEQKNLKILTIHKSKGLEFEHTIIIDRLSKKKNVVDNIIFDYKDIHIDSINYKITNREHFDAKYKRSLDKEKNLEKLDSINTLYVALTRAKKSLIILKKSSKSEFDIIKLKTQKSGILDKAKEPKSTKIDNNKIEYEKLQLGKQSDLIQIDKEEKEYKIQKRYFGIALHYTLEIMDSFTIESLKKAILNTKSIYHNYLNRDDFKSIESRLINLVKSDKFQNLINEDSIVYKEQLINYNGELKQLDLLIENIDNFIVVDYKTSEYVQNEHKKQVNEYKKAIELISNKNVIAKLCYIKDSSVDLIDL